MTNILKIEPIFVYQDDKAINTYQNWALGLWFMAGRQIWGLTYYGDATHMCYELDSSRTIKEHIEHGREMYKETRNEDWIRWYFDVGRRVYVTYDALEAASKKLGIYEGPTNLEEGKENDA